MKRTMAKARAERNEEHDRLLSEVRIALRSFTNAEAVLDDAAVDVLGINRSDGRCLDILDQSGPLTAGELARRADLSTAAITALVDRMERAGYVTRVRDTVDRRRVLIADTQRAESRCAAIWGPINEEGAGFLDGFTDDELRLVTRFMEGAREFLLGHLERIKSLGLIADEDADGPPPTAAISPAQPGKIPA
jgi:DNA-binding MarR family transcriptional regulator